MPHDLRGWDARRKSNYDVRKCPKIYNDGRFQPCSSEQRKGIIRPQAVPGPCPAGSQAASG